MSLCFLGPVMPSLGIIKGDAMSDKYDNLAKRLGEIDGRLHQLAKSGETPKVVPPNE